MMEKPGNRRHEEYMFALHGAAKTDFSIKSGMEINIESLLSSHGASPAEATETARAIYRGLERQDSGETEKRRTFIAVMIAPFLKDKNAGFTARPDPQKMNDIVGKIMEMAERRSQSGQTSAPSIETKTQSAPRADFIP